MKLFNRQRLERTLFLAAVTGGTVLVSGALAQEMDSAYVPFRVNAAATVTAEREYDGVTLTKQISVDSGTVDTLRLPIATEPLAVIYGAQRRANIPAIICNRNGKITINLPAQSYKRAEISLYTINGKRILRNNASAANGASNISRRNIATGVYMLSIKGAVGAATASRLTHSGGGLNINVVFDGENQSSASRLAKRAVDEEWRILVRANGFNHNTYTLSVAAGRNNPLQDITLHSNIVMYKSVVIGGVTWMAENLNIETEDSWCYNNSPDSCAKYGRLYTWTAAMSACPRGWRLPSRRAWEDLYITADGVGDVIVVLTAKNGDGYGHWGHGTDDLGFSALPGGLRGSDGYFTDAGYAGEWWTATEDGINDAYYRYMRYYNNRFSEGSGDKSEEGRSVRCILMIQE